MKQYLLYIMVLVFCFGIAATLCADPNEPSSIAEPNDLSEPNIPKVVVKPKVDKAPAKPADTKKGGPGIIDAVKFKDQLELKASRSNDPNEPNEPGSAPVAPVAPVARKHPDVVSVSIFPAVELPQFKYRLLPLDMERTDGDAADFYVKAIDALPADFSQSAVNALLDAATDKFNTSSAAAIVNSSAKSLDLIAKGSLSRKCQWPDKTGGKETFSLLEGLNALTSVVALKARLETSRGEYKTAVKSIRDGLAMARHIADTSSTIQTMAAINTASVMLKNVEQIVQTPNSPSLYRSLGDLPKPLVNLNKPPANIEYSQPINEFGRDGGMGSGPYGGPGGPGAGYGGPGGFGPDGMGGMPGGFETDYGRKPGDPVEESTHSRKDMLLQMNKLDRLVAVLQCVEGLRYYAAVRGGKLPETLADVSDLSLPLDPVTQRPFRYFLGAGKALLGSPVSDKQSDHESTIYFEIKIK